MFIPGCLRRLFCFSSFVISSMFNLNMYIRHTIMTPFVASSIHPFEITSLTPSERRIVAVLTNITNKILIIYPTPTQPQVRRTCISFRHSGNSRSSLCCIARSVSVSVSLLRQRGRLELLDRHRPALDEDYSTVSL